MSPKFEKGKGSNGKPPAKPPARQAPAQISDPRCQVCQHPMRKLIDRMLAMGQKYTDIERIMQGQVKRRSLSNHDKQHLGYEEAAIRRIIEREADLLDENVEEGVQGLLTRRVYANAALHKAMEALLSDDIVVTPKEALGIMEYLDAKERELSGAEIDQIRLQFNAFIQAMRELLDDEMNKKILNRTRELLSAMTIEVNESVPEQRRIEPPS